MKIKHFSELAASAIEPQRGRSIKGQIPSLAPKRSEKGMQKICPPSCRNFEPSTTIRACRSGIPAGRQFPPAKACWEGIATLHSLRPELVPFPNTPACANLGDIQPAPIKCQGLLCPEQVTRHKGKVQPRFLTQFLRNGIHLSLVRSTIGIPADRPLVNTDLNKIVDLR